MTLTDRERGICAAFGAAHRRYERWMTLLVFFTSLSSGLMGAYFGVRVVMSLFSAVAIVICARFAAVWLRKALGH